MALKFSTTQQEAKLHGVKCLIYGKAGYGKTFLATTAPAPIILSAEAGLLTLKDYDLPVIKIETVEDLAEAEKWLRTNQHASAFQTVILDSITEIAEVVLANAMRQVKDNRQAYGELIEKMVSVIKAYRDLSGKHVVMLAKQGSVKDESIGTVMNGPMMPGSKLGPALPYYFDVVLRLGINKDPKTQQPYRFLQAEPDFQNEAKNRGGYLDPIEPPNLSHVFQKIMG